MNRITLLCLLLCILFPLPPHAQDDYGKVQIQTTKLANGIYMLEGAGGNIGLSTGQDGVFLIDDQYSPLTPKILAAINKISKAPVKFMINTHWHFDHTGGNENLGKQGVIIVAHDNVYQRLSSDQFMKAFNKKIPASPKVALPVVTFNDKVTFHLNELHIQARHFQHAHTDGDSVIFFNNSNVIHMGDLFFNGMYPFIDSGSGGSIYGVISAVSEILRQIDDKTQIIPGHGPLANKQLLQNYHDMLVKVVAKLTPLAKKGLSVEDVKKLVPLTQFNKKWGQGYLTPDDFLGFIYPTIVEHNISTEKWGL